MPMDIDMKCWGARPELARERDSDREQRSAARRAVEMDFTAEVGNPVANPFQTASIPERAAGAVIANRHAESPVLCAGGDDRPLCTSMLGDVGETLGHDEIGSRFDGRREAARQNVGINRNQ